MYWAACSCKAFPARFGRGNFLFSDLLDDTFFGTAEGVSHGIVSNDVSYPY